MSSLRHNRAQQVLMTTPHALP
ncbi:hypothetical protein PENARI_c005G07422 [Penicillium arizonense]|uniref:Uncharacterized protein n=1 Tax=Penicillium arizonense TaxID=1835702 RepID=A0A1F5LNK3_PENAI|nr:hypothetical protein PENARI_c005G07422 [Penicillium arizonense]